jgi:hypothetical protein
MRTQIEVLVLILWKAFTLTLRLQNGAANALIVSKQKVKIMKKKTVQLTYELCVQHMERWHALGRNYTAVQRPEYQKGGPAWYPEHVVFHQLDMDTVHTGIRVIVREGYPILRVGFPPFEGRFSKTHNYPMDAVPVQPFKNEERVKVWKEFIDAMQTPRQQEREIVIQ